MAALPTATLELTAKEPVRLSTPVSLAFDATYFVEWQLTDSAPATAR